MQPSLPARLLRFSAALLLALATACSVSPEITFDPGTDFQVVLGSSQVSLAQGGQTSLGVQVAWLGNCGCPDVQLSVKGAPAGLTTAFDLNPTATGTTLVLSASAGLPPGTYPLTLTGVRGTLSHSETLAVQVTAPAPDFSVRITPAYLAISPGGSGTVGVQIARSGGFAEAATLSLAGAPSGITATFPALPLGAQGVQDPSAGDTGVMLLSVAPGTAGGTYRLSVTATTASRVRTATLLLEVQALADFSLALAPTSLSTLTTSGGAGPVTVTLTRAPGFTSAVGFALEGAPAGCTGAFAPASTTGPASTLGLTLAGVAPGTYPLTVRASAGALSRAATLLLTVSPPPADFTVGSVSVTAVQGGSGGAGVVLTPVNGFAGAVALSASGLPAGVTTTFTPNPATPAGGSSLSVSVPASVAPGTYNGTLRAVSGALDHAAALTLTVQPPAAFNMALSPSSSLSLRLPNSGKAGATTTLLIEGSGGFAAPVTLEAVNPPAGVTVTFAPNPATTTALVSIEAGTAARPGTTALTLRGTAGALVRTTVLDLTLTPPPDFTLTPAPASASVNLPLTATATTSTTVDLAALNGFAGTAALSVDGLPAGVTAAFAPASAAVPGSSVLTLTVSPRAVPGTSVLTLHGASGALDRTATFTLTLVSTGAPSFSVSLKTPAVTVQPGTTDRTTVTVDSLGGFAGTVNLSHLDPAPGMVVNFNPNPVVLTPGASVTSLVSLSTGPTTPGAVYATTVRGAAGALATSSPWSITVQDFVLGATPATFDFVGGSNVVGAGTFNLSRINGLANPVSITATPPAGYGFTVTPPSTTGNSAAFTFAAPTYVGFEAMTAVTPGIYTIPVTAVAGTWSRSMDITLRVQDFILTAMPTEYTGTGGGFPVQLTATRIAGQSAPLVLTTSPSALWNSSYVDNPMPGATTTWNLSPGTAVPPGSTTLWTIGTAGLSRFAFLTINTVTGPDFYIHLANPGTGALQSVVTLPSDGSTTLLAVVNPVAGFTGAPTFTQTMGAPQIIVGFAPASSGTSTVMTLTTAPGLPPGQYSVMVQAAFGAATSITRTAELLVLVP